jgi:hypothetical protein
MYISFGNIFMKEKPTKYPVFMLSLKSLGEIVFDSELPKWSSGIRSALAKNPKYVALIIENPTQRMSVQKMARNS